jgi:hypothetical protein
MRRPHLTFCYIIGIYGKTREVVFSDYKTREVFFFDYKKMKELVSHTIEKSRLYLLSKKKGRQMRFCLPFFDYVSG